MKCADDHAGFTLAEAMIAMLGSVVIIGALLMGSMGLQKAFHASELYASSLADQRRVIDYVSRDLRRAIGIATSVDAGASTQRIGVAPWLLEDNQGLVVTLPAYYKSNDPQSPDYDQPLSLITSGDQVAYGNKDGPAPAFSVIYRRLFLADEKCVCFVRYEADDKQIIVRQAETLHLQLTVTPDGQSCALQAWFQAPSGGSKATITTYDQVMLRNVRID